MLKLLRTVTFKETLRDLDGDPWTMQPQINQWVPLFDFMRDHFELAHLHGCIDFTEASLRFTLTFGDGLKYTIHVVYYYYVDVVRNARDLLTGLQNYHVWLDAYADLEGLLRKNCYRVRV